MKFFQKLKLLLWKNLILYKRHWILTLIKITGPLFFYISGPYILKTEKLPYTINETINPPLYSTRLYKPFWNKLVVTHFPNKTDVDAIMKGIQKALRPKEVNNDTRLQYIVAYTAVNKTTLDYSIISMDGGWDIDAAWNLRGTSRPGSGSFKYIDQGYLSLQLAIEASYLYNYTNRVKKFAVQEFPHPKHLVEIPANFIFRYCFTSMTSSIIFGTNILLLVVEEKKSGMKGLMTMMGLHSWLVWVAWFLHGCMVNVLSTLLVTLFLKAPWHGKFPTVKYSSFSALYLFLFVYNAAAISFCLAISSFFHNSVLGGIFGILTWVMSYVVPVEFQRRRRIFTFKKKMLFLLFPNAPLFFGFEAIYALEERKMGVHMHNLFEPSMGGSSEVTMFVVIMMLICNAFFYLCVSIYIDGLISGFYGILDPFFFPCKTIYYSFLFHKNRIDPILKTTGPAKIEHDYFLPIGIRIRNLSKLLAGTAAVNNLSFDIYKGQITCLLGQNGAGKSTLLSIIGGLIKPTSGHVQILGHDIRHHLSERRYSIGVCFQTNFLFSDLNVMEHLRFFGMLKGLSMKKAHEDACFLLRLFNMYDQRYFFKFQLSSGMKRKVSFGIAIIGNPQVLLLDEPTSGLDPSSCRVIWNILLSFKKSRVVLFSTHNMEEADVLADRIGILNEGRLVCYGTSNFLKQEFGNEYQFSVTFNKQENNVLQRKQVLSITKNTVPPSSLRASDLCNLTFSLSNNSMHLFPSLLDILEKAKDDLHIINMKLSIETVSYTYLRVNEIVSNGRIAFSGSDRMRSFIPDLYMRKTEGYKKLLLQFVALIEKRYLIEKRKFRRILCLITMTAFVTVSGLYYLDTPYSSPDRLNLNLQLYKDSRIYYSVGQEGDSELENLANAYKNIVLQQVKDVRRVSNISKEILEEGQKNIKYYRRYLSVAVHFDKINSSGKIKVIAMHSPNALHAAPISVTLAINALATVFINASVKSANSPFKGGYRPNVSKLELANYVCTISTSALLLIPGIFYIIPIQERIGKVKHLQIMTGTPLALYWMVFYIWDLMIFFGAILAIILVIVLYGLCFSYCSYCNEEEIKVLFFQLAAYACSIIPYTYVQSFIYKRTISISMFLWSNLILSIALVFLTFCATLVTGPIFLYNLLNLLPTYGLCMCMYYTNKQIQANYAKIEEVCVPNNCYFYGQCGIFWNIVLMFLSSFLYWTILFLLETDTKDRLLKIIFNRPLQVHAQDELNEENDKINSKLERISKKFRLELNDTSVQYREPFLSHNITKRLHTREIIGRIGFAVQLGECLGFFGSNGCGKTTLFSLLTRDSLATAGNARINYDNKLYYLSTHLKQYRSMIGYCPTKNIIISGLTGQEMLSFFGKLRGVIEGLEDLVALWIDRLGLSSVAHKKCQTYSKGYKRRLSIGIALIGSPLIIMLDEPSTSVDLESCQDLWNILNDNLNKHESACVILGTHTPESFEKIFDEFCILESGRIKSGGRVEHLRNRNKKGFSLRMKINTSAPQPRNNSYTSSDDDFDITRAFNKKDEPKIINLMDDISTTFQGCFSLIAEYDTLLHYHIYEEKKSWSQMYIQIDKLQSCYPVIQGYVITEMSLDELSLSNFKATT